jgi:hypothetical protein
MFEKKLYKVVVETLLFEVMESLLFFPMNLNGRFPDIVVIHAATNQPLRVKGCVLRVGLSPTRERHQ